MSSLRKENAAKPSDDAAGSQALLLCSRCQRELPAERFAPALHKSCRKTLADGTVKVYRYRNARGRLYVCGDCRSAHPPARQDSRLAVVERRLDRLELRLMALEAESRRRLEG